MKPTLFWTLLLLPAVGHAPLRAQAAGGPLTLAQAQAAAFGSSPALVSAAQSFAQAQARLGQADAGRRLQITFNSTGSLSTASVYQPPPTSETFGTLQNTLTVPLPIGARPGLVVRQAREQLSAEGARLEAARLALGTQVTGAYFDLLRKQALLAVNQETLLQDSRALADARTRQLAGDVAQIDVLQAQVPVAAAQAALDGSRNDLDVARQTLNGLIGRPLDDPLQVADVAPGAAGPPGPLLSYTLDQARALVLARSPDIRAAQDSVRAAAAALDAARLFRDPTLSLQAIDIRSKDVTSFRSEDTVQAAVTLPLSDGGLGRAQVQEAQAALAGARANVEVARRAALAAVSAAYLTAQSRQRQVAAALVARDVAQETYDKTVLGYRSGLFPLLEVLNAQAALTQARIAYTQAVYDAAAAAAGLAAAFGGASPVTPAGTTAPAATAPAAPLPLAPPAAAGNGGTSPAGTSAPGTSPAGNSTTGTNATGTGATGTGAAGTNAGGAGAGGRGATP